MIATTPEAVFLADIIANPQDDHPRLVYADWLEEHGQEKRAEFIRVQIAIHALDCELLSNEDCEDKNCSGCAERRVLLRRETELLTAANALAWGPDVEAWQDGLKRPFATIFSGNELANPNELPTGYVGTRFRRGFVAGMVLPLADWQRHGKLLVATCPLETVRISDREPMPMRDGGFGWWRVLNDEEVFHDHSALPHDLFGLLVCEGKNEKSDSIYGIRIRCSYSTIPAAHAALSAACLTLARKETKLP